MLLLNDRGFDADDFLAKAASTGAQLLVRLKGRRAPARQACLPDGTYLTRINGVALRIIDAHISVTTAKGLHLGGDYRLATTLTDHRRYPASELIALYHERWEIESAFYALRHTLLQGLILRSQDACGIEQELWAQLTLYQALRRAMTEAVESVPGTDPDRAAFTVALETARDQVVAADGILPAALESMPGRITNSILSNLLPARRPRISPRRVKCPISRYAAPPAQRLIDGAATITSITTTVLPASTLHPDGRRDRTLQLMRTDPHRPWTAREIAAGLGLTHHRGLTAELSRWVKEEMLSRTAPGTYALTREWAHPEQPISTAHVELTDPAAP